MKRKKLFGTLLSIGNNIDKINDFFNNVTLIEIRNKKNNELIDLIYTKTPELELRDEFGENLKNIQKENNFFYHKLEIKEFEFKRLILILINNNLKVGYVFFENIFYKLENIKHIFEIKLIKKNG